MRRGKHVSHACDKEAVGEGPCCTLTVGRVCFWGNPGWTINVCPIISHLGTLIVAQATQGSKNCENKQGN